MSYNGYPKNRAKRRDNRSDILVSLKRDTEAEIGELFWSREANVLSFKKNIGELVRYDDSNNSGSLPYKVFTASLTMSADNIPVANILENTLGIDVFFERGDAGDYYAIFSDTIFNSIHSYVTISPTFFQIGNTVITMGVVPVFYNVLNIQSRFNSLPSDEVIGGKYPAILEIRVYNDTII